MRTKNKQLLVHLSTNDYNLLVDLCKPINLSKSEYIRTFIQVVYIITQIAENKNYNNKIKIGGYGITLPLEFIEKFYDKLKSNFKNVSWSTFKNSVELIPSQRNYNIVKNKRNYTKKIRL